jgi:E3 ubiquitin-protein ligase DOA10
MKYVLLSIKVIFFFFIELAIFPMVCGILIIFCTLPVLGPENTIASHYNFFINNIWITQFLYWLTGTSFMFQLALYVGIIKEILRPGALWFVSDPNDPQFQPIKEIIEKPVLYQLRKLFNSFLMYFVLIFGSIGGTVVLLQVVGIIWIYLFNHGNPYGIGMIWPLNYDYSNSTIQFPADLLLYLFLVPFIVNINNTKVWFKKAVEGWFRKVSHILHISEFMFKGKYEDEESDCEEDDDENDNYGIDNIKKENVINENNKNDDVIGDDNNNNITELKIKKIKKNGKRRPLRRLRVPNTDHIKIVPGEKILIPMNDGEPLFGREGETPEEVKTNWTIVYRPNHFKLRIYCLLFLHWVSCITLFSSIIGVPLILGRFVVKIIDSKYYNINNYINPPSTKSIRPDLPVHDGQSLVIGILILLFIAFNIYCINKFIDGNMKRTAKLCFVYIKLYFKEKVKKEKLKTNDENNEKESLLHSSPSSLPINNEEAINIIKNEQVLPEPRVFISIVGNWWIRLFKNTFDVVLKTSYISVIILFVVPMLFGLIFEFYIISVIRIPLTQSNILVISDIWSYGLVLLSIMVSIINIGPQTRFKTIFQEIRNDGFFNFKLKTLHKEVVAPTIKVSILLIIAPLIFAYIILWVYFTLIAPDSYDFIRGFEIVRFSFIGTLMASLLIEVWYSIVDVCNKWIESVKDEEYLIGRKLHNIEEDVNQQAA